MKRRTDRTQEIYRAAGKMIIIKVASTQISFRNYKVRKRSRSTLIHQHY